MAGTLEISAVLTGIASGFTLIAGAVFGFIGSSEAACFAAGGTLALTILASGSKSAHDALHPARLELARHRRSEKAADILVVKAPPGKSLLGRDARRRSASAASSVLRVTDGVSVVPSGPGSGICAVLEADARARTAIELRLRNACGSEVRLGWASYPNDGVTLESLISVALDRLTDHGLLGRTPSRQQVRVGNLGLSSLRQAVPGSGARGERR
jgi:hypothetical protein